MLVRTDASAIGSSAERTVPVSVLAGRVFLAITGAVCVAALVGAGVAWRSTGSDAGGLGILLAIGGIAAVLWVVGAVLTVPFVEATVDAHGLVIRRVWGRRRVVEIADVDEVVVLADLILPSRVATAPKPRVVLRREGAVVATFTPRDAAVVADLARCGWAPVTIADPLTPSEATRRYPGSVGRGERFSHVLPLGAVVVGAAVAIGAVIVAVGR
ncbi:hypothetical protein KZC52_13815 [Microbacterium sp. kSW2-24]|uniref:hypothetical protein n=1 Tax=Microbacterium galbinum TaxID=2851646 RepID=UPI001FFDA214|nr:hypothetical protein [Microbacterium galbinum]MCK2024011.1 hypothetical protein [Microbacterium galbinum]